MGKLTYSARKTTGTKAGQTVSKDLKKRIPPGIGSKSAARDPTLEIDLAGKCLTDEGLAQFIDDLLECIKYRDEQHPVGMAKVTELYLQGNQLTAESLPKLGEVVAHSAGDLRELDISKNDINISTAQQKEKWKAFFDSFRNCYLLKKLDISGNPIGPAGLEVLARVYIKSELDYLEDDADAFIGENLKEETLVLAEDIDTLKISSKENESRTSRLKKALNKGKAAKQGGTSPSTLAATAKNINIVSLKKYACTRGLRSIPYFILSDIAIKNCSAVHLAQMLSIQRASEQLLGFLPPGKTSAIPESAQDNKSLIWQPNEGLTAYVQKFLDVTETRRDIKSLSDESDGDVSSQNGDTQRKIRHKLAVEYSRLTKRVRMESLKLEGVRSNEIAFTALKMFVVSRALLLDDNDRPVDEPLEEEYILLEGRYTSTGDHSEEEDEPILASSIMDYYVPQYQFVSSFPLGPFHPAAEMFDIEFPVLEPPRPKGITSTESGSNKNTPGSSPSPFRSGKGTARPHPSLPPKSRKEGGRFGLPFHLWRRIIADAIGADAILDLEQQDRIMQYASDWEAVAYELTIKGAEDHQQIWKFLETVGCFTYTPLP